MAKGRLTPKQEAFARAYIETGNASEAYRQSYNVGENTKPQTVWEAASRALADSKVATRVMELQEAARERSLVTIESITNELDEYRKLARSEKQASAAITATMGKAKLHGLITDKQHTKIDAGGELAAFLAKIAEKGKKLGKDDRAD